MNFRKRRAQVVRRKHTKMRAIKHEEKLKLVIIDEFDIVSASMS